MAGLTKTQINYLENKLQRVVDDKVQEFKKELGEGESLAKAVVKELKAGTVKIMSKSELVKLFDEKVNSSYSYYHPSFYIEDLIATADRERIEDEVSSRDKKINEFRDRLIKAKTNALDKIVLEGVDVESAIAELNNIQ